MSDTELKSRILHLQDTLRKLRELQKHSKTEFLSNFRISDATLHNLQLAIESITDIGNYLLRRKTDIIPETRSEVFEALCRIGILEKSAETELIRMAKFRNLLVHAYATIDLQQVYEILHNQLPFLESIANTLSKQITS
jgi:uncharacterized protein YutE (UPF0331/DUF86 family)